MPSGGRRWRATPTQTSRSSAPDTPVCGPPTTSPRPIRRCGSSSWKGNSRASAPPGRNGGWCSSLFPSSLGKVAKIGGSRERAIALQRAMNETVDEVGRVVAEEGIDCHFAKGGTVVLARTQIQLARAKASVEEERSYGFGEEDVRLLSASEASAMVGATNVLGGTFTPHCAAIQPAMLARGLAEAVERLGVTIHEQTTVAAIRAGVVETATAPVRAGHVVRATEGYTPSTAGCAARPGPGLLADGRDRAAAGRGLGADRAGRAARPSADYRHLIIYGQRTADGRLVVRRTRRAVPLRLAHPARLRPRRPRASPRSAAACASCSRCCRTRSSPTAGAGRSASPRDWFASVGCDRADRAGLGRRLRRRRRRRRPTWPAARWRTC